MTDSIQLYLLRHAHAGDPTRWHGSDDLRPLSERGRRQSERLGELLARAGFSPDAILSSPKLRAIETAGLVAESLKLDVRVVAQLGGPLDIDTLEAILKAVGDPKRPLLVGHDPDFSDLTADLAGLAQLPLRKGGLVRLDMARPLKPGAGVIRWLIPPDLLGVDEASG